MTAEQTTGAPQAVDLVTLTIDDQQVSVPKGTLVIRAAEMIGVVIPRFCDHPLLEPVGACRQCLVEVEGQRKPLASCTTTVTEGMVVRTQQTSPAADKAQHGIMEFLLINHPLDCPVCDKGGECPLQNQAMAHGRSETRFTDVKRTYPKPIHLSAEILLDRERCVLCARCTRFSEQIAGDHFIELLERGALQQVGIADGEPLDSYFAGNTIQICPVGALTSTDYRFRARPFDLVSTPSICEHCAGGCAQRTDHRRGTVMRRLAGDDPEVNEEWNCDKGRFAFRYPSADDRITTPLVRDGNGLRPASWPEALAVAAAGLAPAIGCTGVLVGGRATLADAYGYAKFARTVLRSNDIDFRARAHSAEETDFLTGCVAGRYDGLTYAQLQDAPVVVLAGFEPEEESPIVFLRLRKAVRTRGQQVITIAPLLSRGAAKLNARLIPTPPGDEAAALRILAGQLRPGSVILLGERLAAAAGAFSAAVALAEATGATLAWIPRRAGERGALEAGCLPTLLPGGRPVADDTARAQTAAVWDAAALPEHPGRDTTAMLAAATAGELGALVVGGVEVADLPDPHAARAALAACGFLVSLELRRSEVTAAADVVLPVAAVTEKSGAFLNWEARWRPFGPVFNTGANADLRVLSMLAEYLGADLGLRQPADVTAELTALGPWSGPFGAAPNASGPGSMLAGPGEAVLAGWRMLLDSGRGQDGDAELTATARPAVLHLSAATAAGIGARDGDRVAVATERGALALPLVITEMPDAVVWVPLNSGVSVADRLGVAPGAVVRIGREP